MTYQPKVYREQGGDKLIVASGGEIEVQSGGTLDIDGTFTLDAALAIGDDDALTLGTGSDAALEWDTAQTQDCLQLGLGASRTLMVMDKADMSADKSLSAFSMPTIVIYDADADNYLRLGHNADDIAIVSATNDLDVACGTTAADRLVLQAYDVGATGYEDMIVLASHATTPTMTLAASGGITVSNNVTIANTMDILPATGGGSDLGSTSAEWGDVFLGDSKSVKFGADQDVALTHDGTSSLNLTVTDNMAAALDVKESANSYIKVITTNDFEEVEFGKPLDPTVGIKRSSYFEFFDDFHDIQTLTEADGPWILNSGSDDLAVDPAINTQERGVIQLVTGDDDGTTAVDGTQMCYFVPVQADSGALVFEARLHINTAITNVAVNVGLTDSTSLEEPFTISGGSVTSTASDAACFTYDTSATTDEWYMCAVDGDADDAGIAATGTAPVADTYQTFRIEVSSDGATIKFYIDGTLEGTLSGSNGVSPDVNLYATVIACGDGTASKSVDVDYVYVGHTR